MTKTSSNHSGTRVYIFSTNKKQRIVNAYIIDNIRVNNYY